MAINFGKAQEILDKRKKDREGRSDVGSGGSKVNWYNLPDNGQLRVRFLPPLGDNAVPGKIVHKHYNMPKHKGINGNITCFRTYGRECPICNVLDEYRDRLGAKQLQEFSASLSFFNVLILGKEDVDPEQVFVLKASDYNYEWLLQQLVNVEVGDITDPTDGANVTFKRKSEKGAFERIISRRSSPIAASQEKIDTILDSMYDLDAIWKDPDDNYYNIANEIADGLRDVIEERLIRMAQTGEAEKKQPVKEVQNAKKTRATAAAPASKEEQTEIDPDDDEQDPGLGEGVEEETQAEPEPPVHRRARPTAAPAPQETPAPAPATSKKRESAATKTDAGAKTKTTTTKTDAGAAKVSTPKGAPDCFGVSHVEGSKKCTSCPFEFDCGNA